LPAATRDRARPSGRASAGAALRRAEPFEVGTGALRRPLSGAFPSAVGQLPVPLAMGGLRQRGHRSAMVPTGLCPKSCKD